MMWMGGVRVGVMVEGGVGPTPTTPTSTLTTHTVQIMETLGTVSWSGYKR